jgi:hypothetical protein
MRRVLVPLFGVLLVSLLSACGAGNTAAPEQETVRVGEPLARAADRAKAAGTSRMAFTAEMTLEGMSEPVEFSGEGVFDYKRCHGRMTWDFSDFGKEAGLDAESEELVGEILFLDERAFWRLPFLLQIPGAKPWIEFSKTDVSDVDAASDELMSVVGGDDPSSVLSFIKGASGDVRNEGGDDVRGVETTHYAAQVDLAKAIDQAPKRDRPNLERALERLKKAGVETVVPVEVWVDREGLARRVRQSWPVVNDEKLEITFDMFDFGVDVDVKAPPANQVMSEKAFDALAGAGE